jgi:hypothetical protein
MKYMIQVFMTTANDELERLPDVMKESVFAEYSALSQADEVIDAHQLQPASSATTVRVQDTGVVTTDGPFTDAEEPLGGYYLIDTTNLDSAIAFASRIPAARMGGTVEVRGIFDRPSPDRSPTDR